MITLPDVCRHFPFVFFRPPIDRLGQTLTFCFSSTGSVLAHDDMCVGEVSLDQPHEKIIADIRRIAGEEHYRG